MNRNKFFAILTVAISVATCAPASLFAREFFVVSGDHIKVFDESGATLRTIGGDDEFLSGVWDVAIHPNDKLYVANSGQGRVEIYDILGNHLGVFGETDVAGIAGFFPRALKFDRHGNLFAVSSGGGVRKFDLVGNDLGFFGDTTTLPVGIRAMEFDSLGKLYVSVTGALDGGGHPIRYGRVEVFDTDGASLGTFGETADVQLLAPNDMVFDEDGNLYVSDGGGVDVFSPDGSWLGTFGNTTILNAGFGGGLAFDSDGNLYAADYNKVEIFDPSGSSLGVFGGTDSSGLTGAVNLAIREIPEPAAGISIFCGLLMTIGTRRRFT